MNKNESELALTHKPLREMPTNYFNPYAYQ